MTDKNLPRWDLSDLYPSIDSKEFKDDMLRLENKLKAFNLKYKCNMHKLSADDFAESIKEYENIIKISHKISVFSNLYVVTRYNDSDALSFDQNTSEKLTALSKYSIFYSLDINNMSDKKIKEMLKNEKVKEYEPWINKVRRFKDYQLSEELEEVLQDKSLTSSDAWVRLYDEHSAKLTYMVDGKEYNDAEISKLVLSPDEKTREKASKEINRVSKENIHIFSHITNTLAKDKQLEDEKRGYAKPITHQNMRNQVEDEVVDALISSVRGNFKNISHRYYKLKAKWFGKDKINYWDRNAPLPFGHDKDYEYANAVDIVLSAYHKFSPKLAELGGKFFENPWIDVPPAKGKRSGAFACPTIPELHPYLMLNYTGKERDVSTLAHELGHGVHMLLSAKQGLLKSSTPLTFAETASVFGEMITFQSLLEEEKDKKAKIAMLAGKTEDMINTAIRQIAFHIFEDMVHNERRKGELSAEVLSDFWVKVCKESLGDAIIIDDNSRYIWSQIPHFIHLPYYVYAYSFGDCLVNSLYKVYKEGSVDNFENKYLDMLSLGGSQGHKEMLAPFNLDASNPEFWNKGLSVISDYIDEIEKLSKEVGLI